MSDPLGRCDLWIHGGGRGCTDESMNGTRIVCDWRVSPAEPEQLANTRSFAPGLTIELLAQIREPQP